MNDAYLHLTIEELTIDEDFIQWVQQVRDIQDFNDSKMINWIKNNPDQKSKIENAQKIVKELNYKSISLDDHSKEHLWNRIEQSTIELSSNKSESNPFWKGMAAAAVILIATAIIWMWPSNTNTISNYQTGVAQNMEKILPDNSKIWMNENTNIAYDKNSFQTDKRTVTLSGEAQFQVSKNKGTFEVLTSQGKITVLGTRFNVIDQNGEFSVQCYEGKVSVEYQNNHWILAAGQSVYLNKQSGELISNNVKKDGQASWINQKQYYTSQKISVVFEQLEHIFNKQFIYDSSISNRLYTGFISKNSLENSLKSVCWPLHLKYTIEKDKVIILHEE